MKVVIDTNSQQTDELWAFLSVSQENLAILPDYVLREDCSLHPSRRTGQGQKPVIAKRWPRQPTR